MTIDFKALSAPFRPDLVSWRVGSTTQDKKKGMALAYIDARDVMVRLDEVCGPENWQRRYPWSEGKRLCCEIGIKVDGEWVWKSDGAGDTDVEAEKGSFSDAFKRAAVSWGIGRYLYELDSPWVELEAAGRSYKIADKEHARLRRLLANDAGRSGAGAPAEQTPPNPGPANFWSRASYGFPPKQTGSGNDWTAWAGKLSNAADAAPNLDALNKLQNDNAANLDGYKLANAEGHKSLLQHLARRRGQLAQAPMGQTAE